MRSFVTMEIARLWVTVSALTLLIVLQSSLGLKYEAPDSCTWSVENNETSRVAVWCRLRTLHASNQQQQNSVQQSLPLAGIQPEGTARLRLECSDVLFFESSLTAGAFQRLTQLDELELENCKLERLHAGVFRGLRDLKRLSVRTHNALWSSSRQLEVSAASFDGLRELQTLELSDNNMREVPRHAFCGLVNLNVLNLSRNALEKLDPVLLGAIQENPDDQSEDECTGADVLVLDVSYNRLSDLPSLLSSPRRRRLQQLLVHDNQLSALRASSLAGLAALRVINASSNRLVDLPAVPLRETCRELREVHLRDNVLHSLGDTFSRLEQLLVLDVARNQLVNLGDSLAGLIRLIVLDLSGNALTRLEAHAFKDLYSLQILDLRDNAIASVADDAFLPLYNLHTLNLAGNQLTNVGPSMLNGLFVLNKLTLSLNLITEVDPRAFRNCSDLKEVDLSGNALTEVPAALSELRFLRTLDLGENRISGFHNGSFRNLAQLTGLRLIDNNIGNVTADMLWDLTGLQVLNLAKNKVQLVARGAFDRNERLEAIRLDANYLTDVNGVFTALPALVYLNLSDNHLVWFDYAFVPPSLQWLDIHANFVEKLGNYYEIVDGFHLRTIDVSHNRLTELTPLSLPNSVEIFFANNNQITRVKPATFSEKLNLTRVDLYANELEYLDLSALRISRPLLAVEQEDEAQMVSRPLPEFFLGSNPFRCDCTMEWLQRVNNMSQQQNYPRVMDLDDVMCRMTHARSAITDQLGGNDTWVQPVVTARASSFLCRYETHCFALCHCCDYVACDCEMTCPHNCSCYHDQSWSSNVVDCSASGHAALPASIPMDATELYLDGNPAMREMRIHAFIGRKNMRALYVNASGIENIQNRTFNGLHALELLFLHDNRLRVLRGYEFDQLVNLRELHLQNNRLTHVSNSTFLPLRSLRLLRLDGNRLASFPTWQLNHNPHLGQLMLANNPWACRCRFSNALRVWTQQGGVVGDEGALRCVSGNSVVPCGVHETNISEEEDEETHAPLGSVIPRLLMNDYLPTVVCTLLLVLLVLVLAVLAFAYRDSVRLWVFARYGVRLFHKTTGGLQSTTAGACKQQQREERDKLYDAYVCYSRKDEELLVSGLATGLEATGYGVCLHHRDLPCAGGSRDPALVIEAAEASRRVLLVVTRGFMQTEWPRRELRAALHEALHTRTFKLIIVEETGGLPPELERDPDLRPYLKTARRIRWGEKKFWERLRYAMPEVSRVENQYRQNICNYSLRDSRRVPVLPPPTNNCTGKRKQPNNHPLFTNNIKEIMPESPSPSPRTSEHIYSSIDPEYVGSNNWGEHWPPHPSAPSPPGPGDGQAYLV